MVFNPTETIIRLWSGVYTQHLLIILDQRCKMVTAITDVSRCFRNCFGLLWSETVKGQLDIRTTY